MSHYRRKCPTPGCPGNPELRPPLGHHGRDCHYTAGVSARLVDWLVGGLVTLTALAVLAVTALAILVEGTAP